jgi:hypothetical protein
MDKKKFFFAFPALLDALEPILTIFFFKMQKSRKSAHPTYFAHFLMPSVQLKSTYP